MLVRAVSNTLFKLNETGLTVHYSRLLNTGGRGWEDVTSLFNLKYVSIIRKIYLKVLKVHLSLQKNPL